MKKCWIIFSAVLIAAIFRGPCFGPFLGLVVGVIVGIPLYLLLCWILELILRKHNAAELTSRCMTIGIMVIFFWIVYHPPASILFRHFITKPIPESVSNLKGASYVVGADGSSYLAFNIHENDLEKIIMLKRFDSGTIEVSQIENSIHLTFTTPKGGHGFNLSNSPSWFNLDNLAEANVYILEKQNEFEYLLYDPKTEKAIYAYITY
jgi:hypothetical protein